MIAISQSRMAINLDGTLCAILGVVLTIGLVRGPVGRGTGGKQMSNTEILSKVSVSGRLPVVGRSLPIQFLTNLGITKRM